MGIDLGPYQRTGFSDYDFLGALIDRERARQPNRTDASFRHLQNLSSGILKLAASQDYGPNGLTLEELEALTSTKSNEIYCCLPKAVRDGLSQDPQTQDLLKTVGAKIRQHMGSVMKDLERFRDQRREHNDPAGEEARRSVYVRSIDELNAPDPYGDYGQHFV